MGINIKVFYILRPFRLHSEYNVCFLLQYIQEKNDEGGGLEQ